MLDKTSHGDIRIQKTHTHDCSQAVGSEMTISKANKKNISDNLKCNRVWEAN